ncbi:Zn-ribbon domain-containing OB-fold protein [Mycobacterium colombiense]|uniref:Zn-ribbon domain-containing OB-fold protein n=1 Tax=Mycobacterium colombiense TaxID=339268 RepID=UPI0026A39328
MSGRARIAAYTVNHQPWIPGFEPPYVVAMVELVEEPDVRLTTNIVGIPPKDVRVGLDVEVFFEDWATMPGDKNSKVWIPLFRPSVGAS